MRDVRGHPLRGPRAPDPARRRDGEQYPKDRRLSRKAGGDGGGLLGAIGQIGE
ncbi:MAG: hypothetical protein MUE73_03180 [Planctomycetes bacterium]|nr:hypothetical protein [Planctomycetota bacterium]